MMWAEISLPCSNLLHPGNFGSFVLLYVDPGSGALAWQLLLSLLFGALFYVRTVTRKVKAFVAGRQSRQPGAKAMAPRLEKSSGALSHTVLTKSEDY